MPVKVIFSGTAPVPVAVTVPVTTTEPGLPIPGIKPGENTRRTITISPITATTAIRAVLAPCETPTGDLAELFNVGPWD